MEIRSLRFRVSGGFAGVVRGTEVTGADLKPAERRALESHVKTGGVVRDGRARDAQVYELEVASADGPSRLEFDDQTLPDDLGALVERLSDMSRPVKP